MFVFFKGGLNINTREYNYEIFTFANVTKIDMLFSLSKSEALVIL